MLAFTTLNSSAWPFSAVSISASAPPASCRISSAPRRVEALDVGGIDRVRSFGAALAGRGTARLVEPLADVVQSERGPGATDLQHRSAAALDEAEGGRRVGHRTD